MTEEMNKTAAKSPAPLKEEGSPAAKEPKAAGAEKAPAAAEAPAPAKAAAKKTAAAKKPAAKKPAAKKPAAKKAPAKRAAAKAAPAKTAAKGTAKKAGAKKITDLKDPALYTNREISWIEFDRKVLETAEDTSVPLLERVNFLSIFFNNLDEFYMVRVMNLQRQARSDVAPTGADKMPPAKQLVEIRRRVSALLEEAEELWLKTLKPALERKDIHFGKYQKLSAKRREFLDRYFDKDIFPILTPQAVDAGHPFPMISNTSMNFVVQLESVNPRDHGKIRFARVKCPNNIPRFLFIPDDADETAPLDTHAKEGLIIMIEDLIGQRLNKLFPGYKIVSQGLFRITRNTDGEIEEDEADDLLAAVRDYVEQRRFGSVVRLELERGMPQVLQDFLVQHLALRPFQVFKSKMPMAFSNFMELARLDRPALKYPTYHPRVLPELEPEADSFAAIREHDICFYHPYESFQGFLNFLSKAAKDPNVVAIKQTLYRVGSHSPVIKALLEARRLGKQVTAVVELKARFDEERNINWAEELEAAGVNVVYGFAGLKIHAKLCLVVRREPSGMMRYVHIGTGNYNASSAKIYTDLSFLSSDDAICDDVQDLFNVMTGCGVIERYKQLLVSPNSLRPGISELIRQEIALHRKDGKGHIILKCNQLVDPDIIRLLYEASQAGVKIECVVRGICCLRPGIKGISDTITVHSIVGRLLEHARVYWFRHGGDNRMYIGSADMMQRNLNGRIEVLVPVKNPTIRRNIIEQIVRPQLNDNIHAWELNSDGSYTKLSPKAGAAVYDSQYEISKVLNLMKR
ncbi:MAG: Polyphosphate kinase [Burkholderia sp.]|jgi:polyphosphate kinase